MNNTHLLIQEHRFSLKRFPSNQFDKSLRAWDAADEYLIDYVCDELDLSSIQNICIVNDSFGALSCAMSRLVPHAKIKVFTDSIMSEHGIEQNLKGSNLDINNVNIHSSLDLQVQLSADQEPSNIQPELILIKIPRTLAYLDYILSQINIALCSHQTNNTVRIIAAGMVKLVTSSALKVFDKQVDGTKTSLARKKSRLIFASPSADKAQLLLAQDKCSLTKQVDDETLNFTLYNFPNVFCREQVDIGARYLLKNLPNQFVQDQVIIDLGCGNGILGTSILEAADTANKIIKLVFVDESYMAIASAKMTLAKSNISEANKANAEFIVSHCLSDFFTDNTHTIRHADIVICNPPFHQQNTVVDDIAWQMFSDAKKVLKSGGELRIVGNRHLEHRVKLVKLFGGCKVVASDKKFVVLSSIK